MPNLGRFTLRDEGK